LESRRGISYDSRQPENEGQSFVFRAEAPGTYALKFYKPDFVRNYILNDHVRVIIVEPPEIPAAGYFNPALDRGRVTAEPRWPTASGEADAFRRSGNGDGSSVSSVPITPVTEEQAAQKDRPAEAPPPAPQNTGTPQRLGPDQYLAQAREEFDAGRVAAAIGVLDQFREWYPSGSDEVYWLYGQFYEANSPGRDIRSALDYYRRLIREYPQSSRCNDARRRIAYLERYYINIQ
jgi:hypothetical protein